MPTTVGYTPFYSISKTQSSGHHFEKQPETSERQSCSEWEGRELPVFWVSPEGFPTQRTGKSPRGSRVGQS